MKRQVNIYLMVDAYGWEIYKKYPILESTFQCVPLRSIYGYSSACIPSILSGRYPNQTGNWCYYYFSPEESVFADLKILSWLPAPLTQPRRIRNLLSKWMRKKLKLDGYFDLYQMPIGHLKRFDFNEKKNPFSPGGLNQGPSIFDELAAAGVEYFVSRPSAGEEENYRCLLDSIAQGRIDFAFCYWPGLDGLMHRVGNESDEIPRRLKIYEDWVQGIVSTCHDCGMDPRISIFSDHGMANLKGSIDPFQWFQSRGFQQGRDFECVVDSTLLRIWYLDVRCQTVMEAALAEMPDGRVLLDDELARHGILFSDRKFGDTIFGLDEGFQFAPSHMGRHAMKGMHGYHPSCPHSSAIFMSQDPESHRSMDSILDIHHHMKSSIGDLCAASILTATS